MIYGVTTGYGDSCTVSIPQALVAELQQARTLARAVPQEMQLERTSDGWSGAMVLRLPS